MHADITCLNLYRDCAMAVIESDQWLTALRRYNSKTDSTPFRELITRMPGLYNYYDYSRLHLYMHGVKFIMHKIHCNSFIMHVSIICRGSRESSGQMLQS